MREAHACVARHMYVERERDREKDREKRMCEDTHLCGERCVCAGVGTHVCGEAHVGEEPQRQKHTCCRHICVGRDMYL